MSLALRNAIVAEFMPTFAQHDPTAARPSWFCRLYAHFDRIAATGHSGVPRDKFAAGLRLATHGRYNIYFRVTDTETIIVRVVHSAREVRRLHFGK